jgi:hypothetical protein
MDPSKHFDLEDETSKPVLTDEQQDEGETPPAEGEPAPPTAEPETGEGEDDETVVSFGDEEPEEAKSEEKQAPEWVRNLRKSDREKTRKLREYEAEIARLKGGNAPPAPVTLGAKPTLEGCEFDPEKYERELDSWHERKRKVDDAKAEQDAAEKTQRDAWQARLDGYAQGKKSLRVQDFDDAEAVVLDTLSTVQQGLIVNGAKNPAAFVYALGKSPKRAKELAAITDPVRFAVEIGALETQLKVTARAKPPVPERDLKGSAPVSAGGTEAHLERLREEARRTGDMTKLHQFKRSLKARA